MIEQLSTGLITAAVMLTSASVLAAWSFRQLRVLSPRLRQLICIGVLLQGLMLVRSPIELPVLPRPEQSSAASEPAGGAEPLAWLDAGQRLSAAVAGERSPSNAVPDRAVVALQRPKLTTTAMTIRLALTVWVIGFTALLLRAAIRYRRLCRLLDGYTDARPSWQHPWRDVCRRHGRTAPKMLVSEASGPMLVRRPGGYVLVVPEAFWRSLSEDQRHGVLLHELAHLLRRDVWRQCLVHLAAAVHWWNPAAWWCVRRYEEAAEWACDESLTRQHPRIARAFAKALIELIEFTQRSSAASAVPYRGIGVQSMATPPLTRRVRRLVQPCASGDSVMKRLILVVLAAALLSLSAVQFRLVAAPPLQDATTESETESPGGELRVLSSEVKQRLDSLRQRLDPNDPASAKLKSLLDREAGRIAIAGLIERLHGNYLDQARAEAIPRFAETYFQADADGKLTLRDSHRALAASWSDRGEQLGEFVSSIRERLQGLADRLGESSETDQLAKRLLSDPDLGFTLLVQEFNGRADPIDLYLDKVMAKVLVRSGEGMIVIPTLGDGGERKIERMALAARAFERLRRELPVYADAFATPDDRHRAFVDAIRNEPIAAIMALQMAKEGATSATAAVDELFSKLEGVARDTADGLVIEDRDALATIGDLVALSRRAAKRAPLIQTKMNRIADELDTGDPLTIRFEQAVRSGVLAYQLAAEIPYAEFDVGKEIETAITANLEPTGDGGLTVKESSAAEVKQQADEWLTACRTVRRYLRRIDGLRERLADRELAESLDGPGRLLLLAEVKRHAENTSADPMQLLRDEFFTVDDASGTLAVRNDRSAWVDELALRAEQLQRELSKDDF